MAKQVTNIPADITKLKGDVSDLKVKDTFNSSVIAKKTQEEQSDSSVNFDTGHKLISSGVSKIDGKEYQVSLEMVKERSTGVINARINIVYDGRTVVNHNLTDRGELILQPSTLGSPGTTFTVSNSGTAASSARFNMWGTSNRPDVVELGWSSGFAFYAQRNQDNSRVLTVNGSVVANNISSGSDRELKKDINIIDHATERLRKMNGYTYTLKSDGMPYAGVIAQEAMEAIPEVVGGMTVYADNDDVGERFLTVNYSGVVGLLVQVCRETDNRVSKLESEISELRELINTLTNKN